MKIQTQDALQRNPVQCTDFGLSPPPLFISYFNMLNYLFEVYCAGPKRQQYKSTEKNSLLEKVLN